MILPNNGTLAFMKAFFQSEAAGGVVLMASAILAIALANSPLASLYLQGVHASHLFINDFLMAIFFLFAGLEIKREMVVGALSDLRSAVLPIIAAVCGMVVPALIYLMFASDYGHGWAIPSATDIAFALGVLALAGKRVPGSLKVLLMAIAVIDDLGAIIVIALFYSSALVWSWMGLGAAALAGMIALNRCRISSYIPYIALALVLWLALFKAGIHPTIAGVLLGFCIPMPMLRTMQHAIEPYVVFAILPLFGLANAGVSFAGIGFDALLHPVTLGIGLGLFVGKQLGIFAAIYLCVKTGLCRLAEDVKWNHIWALSLMCGIGFTMALFVGGLAFADPQLDVYIRMGVLGGSILSGLLGYTVLSRR